MTDMATSGSVTTGDGVSQEMYDKLKAEFDQKTQDLAEARARSGLFEAKERTRITAFQPAAQEFMADLMADADAETKADLAPLQTWSNEFHDKADILSQAPLARLVACASAKLKRSRDEASANATASGTLGQTMKDLEAITGERDSLKQRLDEVSALADERQLGLEKLQDLIARAGLVQE